MYFEISHFCIFRTSVTDLGSGHTAYCRLYSSTYTYIPNSVQTVKSFCGQTDTETGL